MLRGLLQTTLDLFAPVVDKSASKQPLAHTDNAPVAIVLVASGSVAKGVEYRHPGANRSLQLPGALVGFALKRSQRRSIGFVVGAQGLVVSAPKWVPLAEVDAAVRSKGRWIVQKLGQSQERQAAQQANRVVWQNGAAVPYLGQPLTLVLEPALHRAHKGALWIDTGLRLALPLDATSVQIRDAVHKWLLLQARTLFVERLNHFAPLLGVQWKRLALSNASTRWGSASSTGSIRLNWRLLHHRMAVIDYVVVHELSHLRYMDHSAQFWATVGSILPGYAPLRAELRSVTVPKWDAV
jgi:predicted metal-dependent hydrolase